VSAGVPEDLYPAGVQTPGPSHEISTTSKQPQEQGLGHINSAETGISYQSGFSEPMTQLQANLADGDSGLRLVDQVSTSDFAAQPSFEAFMVASVPLLSMEDMMPIDGQDYTEWYSQVYANSVGALDYPFLAATEFDPPVDLTGN
jgi:hypothetical protein